LRTKKRKATFTSSCVPNKTHILFRSVQKPLSDEIFQQVHNFLRHILYNPIIAITTLSKHSPVQLTMIYNHPHHLLHQSPLPQSTSTHPFLTVNPQLPPPPIHKQPTRNTTHNLRGRPRKTLRSVHIHIPHKHQSSRTPGRDCALVVVNVVVE